VAVKIEAVLFDAYGTLFDLRSAVTPHAGLLGDRMDRVSALWRQKQLEYTWTSSLRGQYRDFEAITGDALDFALAAEGIPDAALRAALMRSSRDLQPYADAEATLRNLHQRGLRLGILSNGTPAMLEQLIASQSFARLLDPVVSVDAVRVFKPDARVYRLGADALGLQPAQIAFVSGNAWDAGGAAGFGFRVFWINRTGQPLEYGLANRATVIPALHALAAALP
jgi:2-haloacid dehalogenase